MITVSAEEICFTTKSTSGRSSKVDECGAACARLVAEIRGSNLKDYRWTVMICKDCPVAGARRSGESDNPKTVVSLNGRGNEVFG